MYFKNLLINTKTKFYFYLFFNSKRFIIKSIA